MADSKLVYAPRPQADDESFFRAPVGTTLPTDALDVLGSPWEGHGFVSEDGFRVNISRDTTKHRAFGGKVVKVTQDAFEETIQVTFWEQSPNVLQTIFGDANVTVDLLSGHRKMTVNHDDDPLERQSFCIRTLEGAGASMKTVLWVIPEGQVTEVDEFTVVHNEIWGYTATIDTFTPNPNDGVNTAGVNVHYDEPGVTSGT